MINPIYKFEIDSRQFYPIYNSDLSKVFEKENGEEFFRAKLNGSLKFVRDDYDYIMSQVFDYKYLLTIYISYNAGSTWTKYWEGRFWRTDCDINEDDKVIEVTPKVVDQYTDILDGMDKEYDLIRLAPVIDEVYLDKRGMIQIYTPGESVVSCFLAGMWWEEECSPQDDLNALTQKSDGKPCFDDMAILRFAKITNRHDLVVGFYGQAQSLTDGYQYSNGDYTLTFTYQPVMYGIRQTWTISKNGTDMWTYLEESNNPTAPPMTITLSPISGSGATDDVVLDLYDSHILGRYISDVETIGAVTTYELSNEDFVFNNRNYRRVCGYNFPNTISISASLSSTPTKWGIYEPGQYYVEPSSLFGEEFFPVARSYWTVFSIWFNFPLLNPVYEEESRKQILLKNAYPIDSAISVLLGQFASNITHLDTSDYSKFLYGQNPITGDTIHWMITPKSNILVGEYDQPAQKAPVTLRQIFDMLRDCFRCYWFVESGKLKIEHIYFFNNGGSYSGIPSVGRDLTTEMVTRNGKKWAFCTSKYSFEKSNMPSRYEFGWMDDATEYFNGAPIDIISNYVDKSAVEKIDVSNFSSDVDFLMLEPSRASRDGFVLLGAVTPPKTNLVESSTANKALLITGAQATVPDWSISDYIPVTDKCIRGSGDKPEGAIYVKYAVYDSNHSLIRTGNGDYYPQAGDAYVRFTLPSNSVLAYYFYYYLPYYSWYVGTNQHLLQNGLAAFVYLEEFYLYDLPAMYYSINGVTGSAYGIKKNKKQTLNFPCIYDPNLVNLIKTNMGNGKIGKISINLSSRNANVELMYDTE